ncbi:fungal cellulose binding domain-containing protein [Rhizoctonia solani AG-1 IA]|uniref:Fungal cellulose binding domain-containing protein n=1 Tax=Thanatephorus cucumeris (strain AG1-IA) TaxID=983506 RepID=L8WWI1_THACA|nr:fungal cellulose binding domain-containing protein [Rhizoctonia solani AG-1 IA]
MHPYLYLIALLAQIMPAYTQSNTDVPIGGMCGGLGWSGLTTCVAGGWCRYSTCEPVPPTPDPAHTNPITETVSWTYSSVTQTWPPSVSCNHYARDEHIPFQRGGPVRQARPQYRLQPHQPPQSHLCHVKIMREMQMKVRDDHSWHPILGRY